MEGKIPLKTLKATGLAVHLELPARLDVHRPLLGFLAQVEDLTDIDVLKADHDFSNLDLYEFIDGRRLDIHLLSFSGPNASLHVILRFKHPERKQQLMEKILQYFSLQYMPDLEEEWAV